MAYLSNLLPHKTEPQYQHQDTNSLRRVGAVPNPFGLKLPPKNLWFMAGQPLPECSVTAEP